MDHNSNIWINGAEGFIGSWLWNDLRKKNYRNIVISGLNGDLNLFNHKTERLDICNANSVSKFVNDIRPSHIIHLAAQSHPKYSFEAPERTYETNVMGTINVLNAIRRHVPNAEILIASTSAVYGQISASKDVSESDEVRPLSPYGESKLAMERVCRQYNECYGTNYKAVRIFNTTGPGKTGDVLNDFIDRVLDKNFRDKNEIKVGDLFAKRLFLDVRDTIAAIEKVMLKGCNTEIYNICGNELFSPNDLIKILQKKLGININTFVEPALFRPREEKIIKGSSKKLTMLGWRPTIGFEKTVSDALAWSKKK